MDQKTLDLKPLRQMIQHLEGERREYLKSRDSIPKPLRDAVETARPEQFQGDEQKMIRIIKARQKTVEQMIETADRAIAKVKKAETELQGVPKNKENTLRLAEVIMTLSDRECARMDTLARRANLLQQHARQMTSGKPQQHTGIH